MKEIIQNLTRKIICRLDKVLDMPKYRVKHEDIMVHVTEKYVHITYKGKDNYSNVTLSKESYFAIKDKIKSFNKKHGNISSNLDNQSQN